MEKLKVFLFSIGIMLISCGNQNLKSDSVSSNYSVLSDPIVNGKLDTSLISMVRNYYLNNRELRSSFDSIYIEEELVDSTLQINFYAIFDDEKGVENVSESKNTMHGIFTAYVELTPLMGSESNPNFLKGDLDKDKKEDFIYVVSTEGEGAGMNGGDSYHHDIFVFLKKDNQYKLAEVANDRQLSKCKDWGHFYAKRIENEKIYGESICHEEEDPMCCPSGSFNTILEFQNGHLRVLSSNFAKKIKYH